VKEKMITHLVRLQEREIGKKGGKKEGREGAWGMGS